MSALPPIHPSEFTTPLWRWMDQFLRERIDLHRTHLENPELDATETAMLRARVAEDRHLLNLPRWTAADREKAPPDTQYY